MSISTPLASLAGKPPSELRAALQPLLDAANAAVPAALRPRTPLFMWATAGMRLLPEAAQQSVFDSAFAAFASASAFQLSRLDGFRTLSGEEEGFFGWLAANSLDGLDWTALRPGSPVPPTRGALDLGGASAQVVFALSQADAGAPRRAGRRGTAVLGWAGLDSLRSAVYAKSYLGYGAVAVRSRVREALLEAATSGNVSDPCAFAGTDSAVQPGEAVAKEGAAPRFLVGGGNFAACASLVAAALREMQRAAGLSSIALPGSAARGLFMGMSLLYHVTHFLATLPDESGAVASSRFPHTSLVEVQAGGKALCAIGWPQLAARITKSDAAAQPGRHAGRCFEASLVHTLLGRGVGYGFEEEARSVQFVESVKGTEVEWTLGAALAKLHQSSLAAAQSRRRGDQLAALLLLLLAFGAALYAAHAHAHAAPSSLAAAVLLGAKGGSGEQESWLAAALRGPRRAGKAASDE